MKDTQKSGENTTPVDKKFDGFTEEERAAMRERAQELKAAARRGPRARKADGDSDVLAKIATMRAPDRALAERLHAIIKSSAPALSPKLWYGMPHMPRTGTSFASFRARRSSRRGTRRSASATRRTSTKTPCGRPASR